MLSLSRLCALVGAVLVALWLLFSIQGVRDDAPDMPQEWAWLVLGAQAVLVGAFLANWWRWRAGPLVLLAAMIGYAGAIAGAAAHNGGMPVLAMLALAGPPMLAATPLIAAGWFGEARPAHVTRLGLPSRSVRVPHSEFTVFADPFVLGQQRFVLGAGLGHDQPIERIPGPGQPDRGANHSGKRGDGHRQADRGPQLRQHDSRRLRGPTDFREGTPIPARRSAR